MVYRLQFKCEIFDFGIDRIRMEYISQHRYIECIVAYQSRDSVDGHRLQIVSKPKFTGKIENKLKKKKNRIHIVRK